MCLFHSPLQRSYLKRPQNKVGHKNDKQNLSISNYLNNCVFRINISLFRYHVLVLKNIVHTPGHFPLYHSTGNHFLVHGIEKGFT